MIGLAVGATLTAAILFWLRRSLMVITVYGHSMEPSLQAGDRLLVRRIPARSALRGQLAVVRWPTTPPVPGRPWMVKRIAALAGDPIPASILPVAQGLSIVPPGQLVVLGDNSALSHDSRQLGLLSTKLFLGVVIRRLSDKDPGVFAGQARATALADPRTASPPTTKEIEHAEAT